MIEKSFIVNFFGQSAGALTDTKKRETVNSRYYPDFVNTLNSAVEKNNLAKSDNSIQRKINVNTGNRMDEIIGGKSKEVGPERNNKIKTYKDVAREESQVSSKKEVTSDSKKGKLDKAKKDNQSEADIIEESLAGILNISVEELRMILSALNLDSEDLIDGSKTAEISQKISDLFGLNAEQKETLTKITDLIVKEAKNLIGNTQLQSVYNENSVGKDGWIKLEGVDVQVINQQNLSLENAGNMLKETLNSLENKLKSDPEKLLEDISESMKQLIFSDKNSINVISENEGDFDSMEITMSEDALKPETPIIDSDKSEEKENASADSNSQKSDLQNNYEVINNTQYSQLNDFGNIINNQQAKVFGIDGVSKAQSEINVSPREIITQIVEKAKAVLTNEKSEMIIDLKPDHLGKLSLKVVTERGAVVAKFIAENEQVKAAIESNMDNLKESLNKQGFTVQDFSVSVRQDSKKGFGEGREFSQNNSNSNKGEKIATVEASNVEEKHQVLNPYMVNTSSINLTA